MNKIVPVLAVVIIAVVAAASFFAFQQPPKPTPASEMAGTWDEILQKVKDQGQLNIFVANDLGIQPFLEKNVIPEFSSKFGVKVSISSGHWSGAVQKLVSERAGGVTRGSYDLVILGDEAMARSLESGLLVQNIAPKIPNVRNLVAIPEGRIHGIETRGTAVPIKVDQYVVIFNSDFLDAKDLFKNIDDLDEWLDKHPGRFAFSDPLKSDSGVATLFMAVYGEQGRSNYVGKSYNKSLESRWPSILETLTGESGGSGGGGAEEEPLTDQQLLQTISEGRNWVGILRLGTILNASSTKSISQGVKTFLPEDGSLVSITSAAIPTNSQRKEAAMAFIDYLLGKDVQLKIVEALGSYPAIEGVAESDISLGITKLSTWITISEAKEKRIALPHYLYRADLLDAWRTAKG